MIEKKKNITLQYSFLILMLTIATVILAGPPIRLLSEYLVHIMFGFFFLGLFFLVLDQKKLLLTSFAISGMLCVFLKNESNSNLIQPTINYNPKVSIAHYNLSNINDVSDLFTSIEKEDADLLSFQEYTPDWIQILNEGLKDQYHFNATLVRIDPYGKAIFSKIPILDIDTLNKASFQDLKIKCSLKGNDFYIYSNYITPALDKLSTKNAIDQLNTIGSDIRSNSIPTLAFGEFNMVYWANEISEFRSYAMLNNSRREVVPASFKLPYDHIFYSNDLECIGEGSLLNDKNEKLGYRGNYQLKINLTSAVNQS